MTTNSAPKCWSGCEDEGLRRHMFRVGGLLRFSYSEPQKYFCCTGNVGGLPSAANPGAKLASYDETKTIAIDQRVPRVNRCNMIVGC